MNVTHRLSKTYPQPKTTLDGDYRQVKSLVNHLWPYDIRLLGVRHLGHTLFDRRLPFTFEVDCQRTVSDFDPNRNFSVLLNTDIVSLY